MYISKSSYVKDAAARVRVEYTHDSGLHSIIIDDDSTTLHIILDTAELSHLHYEIEGSLRHAHEEEGADNA